jgi:radical SAM protein
MAIDNEAVEAALNHQAFPDFNLSPFTIIWEVTRACDLLCVHCRASAQALRNPRELTTEEGFRLLSQIKEFGDPVFVLTGGDPMKRLDIFELIAEAKRIGLRVAITPSATPLVTRDALFRLKDLGISRLAISLDGPNAAVHDRFRRVDGSFARTLDILHDASEAGIPLQVNTTVTQRNHQMLDAFKPILEKLEGLVLWSVFFLVLTGRAKERDLLSGEEVETALRWLEAYSQDAPFGIRTTAAPHYRRVVMQGRKERGGAGRAMPMNRAPIPGLPRMPGRPPMGITDGRGFVFISHTGEVYPSGFLPLKVGDVREQSIVDIYREAPLMQQLRDPDALKGKCGYCEYRRVCGGSRARAYAATGDPLQEEPLCIYQPATRSAAMI